MADGAGKKRKADLKPVCKYGNNCYRKNPQHLQSFKHPARNEETRSKTSDSDENSKGGKKTITDYFATAKKTHDLSESDEEENPTTSPKKQKLDSEENEDSGLSENNEDDQVSDTELEPPVSPEDIKENIKAKFLVEMPQDFYDFWEFCKSLAPSKPANALQKSLGLQLVGPFDILEGRHRQVKKNRHGRRPNYLLHYRYFYDPPEFQTVLTSNDDTKFHLGYYRDDPKESPVFVASSSPGSDSKEKLYRCGDNLFAAVHIQATKKAKESSGGEKKQIQELLKAVEEEAKKHGHSLDTVTKGMKERQKRVVCPTFHGAGIVVPVDANEVGYRPVPETPGDLRAMFKKITEGKTEAEREKGQEDVQELITLIQFANDECDYGEGLELGLDLFSYGSPALHPQISFLLPLAYQLLDRMEFSHIISAHLKNRRTVNESVDQLAS